MRISVAMVFPPSGFDHDVGPQLFQSRFRTFLGEIGRGIDDFLDLLVDGLQLILGNLRGDQSRFRTCSIASRSSRIFCTSSRVRYLAGSDMEWPR